MERAIWQCFCTLLFILCQWYKAPVLSLWRLRWRGQSDSVFVHSCSYCVSDIGYMASQCSLLSLWNRFHIIYSAQISFDFPGKTLPCISTVNKCHFIEKYEIQFLKKKFLIVFFNVLYITWIPREMSSLNITSENNINIMISGYTFIANLTWKYTLRLIEWCVWWQLDLTVEHITVKDVVYTLRQNLQ